MPLPGVLHLLLTAAWTPVLLTIDRAAVLPPPRTERKSPVVISHDVMFLQIPSCVDEVCIVRWGLLPNPDCPNRMEGQNIMICFAVLLMPPVSACRRGDSGYAPPG